MKTSKDWLKTDVNGELAPRHVNLLSQETTADDDNDDDDDKVKSKVILYYANDKRTCLQQ